MELYLLEAKAERVLGDDDHRRLRLMYSVGPSPEAVQRSLVEHFTRSLARPGRLTAALNYYRANLGAGGAAWERLANIGPIKTPAVLLLGDPDSGLRPFRAQATRRHLDRAHPTLVLEGGRPSLAVP